MERPSATAYACVAAAGGDVVAFAPLYWLKSQGYLFPATPFSYPTANSPALERAAALAATAASSEYAYRRM
jgi:hypothetical protein